MATSITLETALADLCAKHGTIYANVDFNLAQHEESRFGVSFQWNGHSKRGHRCAFGNGTTIAEALGKAIAAMQADREIACPLPAFEVAA
jgi:hypothetical protein